MTYKFDQRQPGESTKDYLIRHKAHPTLTPKEERVKATDAELAADGHTLPKDHPVYQQGVGIGLTRKGK